MDMKLREACFLGAMIGLVAVAAFGSDVTGVWKGQIIDQGGSRRNISMNLKADGTKISGTVVVGEPPGSALPIDNGRIDGHQVSFQISVKTPQGESAQYAFTAQVAGHQMRGSIAGPEGSSFSFTATMGPLAATAGAEKAPAPTIDAQRPPNPQGRNPIPEDAQKAILALFDKYEVVGGLDPNEGSKDVDDFILSLIRNPALPDKINDIAVECGNSLYQPVLDRYIAGEDVPLSQAQQAWRNTTQPACSFSTLYQELFPLVRRINQRLPPGKRLRVLALDPPVDWSKVKTRQDLRPFRNRDGSIAAVMEKEVLAKHRKALILIGESHIWHQGYGYELDYPNTTFVISPHWGFCEGTPFAKYNDELEKRMASWPIPSLAVIKSTWLADLPSACSATAPDQDGGRGFHGVDGYLYLGPRDLLLRQPIPAQIVMDKGYMAEIQRRAQIRRGAANPERALQEEAKSSVFFYDPVSDKPEGMLQIGTEGRPN